MTYRTNFLRMLLIALLATYSVCSHAQRPTTTPERVTMRVEGLTSETRDALTRELAQTGEATVAFACVPAGILVLEARHGQSRSQLEDRSRSLIIARSAHANVSKVEQTLAQAEAACAQARNR
ncbi:MAG TPA: hypothetical protein PL070_01895 [Flavobacteriales bacterium]|nr:hypothetical protein [Flavobacteriales bacterium]